MSYVLGSLVIYLLISGTVLTIFYYVNKYIPLSTFLLFLFGIGLMFFGLQIKPENVMQEIVMSLMFICATIFISSAFIVNEIYTMRKALNKKTNEKSQN